MNILIPFLTFSLFTCDRVCCGLDVDFFSRIPKKIESAWGTLISVLSQPVFPKRLGTTGRLKEKYRTTKAYQLLQLTDDGKGWQTVKPLTPLANNKDNIPNIPTYDPFSDGLMTPSPLEHNIKIDYSPKIERMKRINYFISYEETTLALRNKVEIPLIVRLEDIDDDASPKQDELNKIKMVTKGGRVKLNPNNFRYTYSEDFNDVTTTFRPTWTTEAAYKERPQIVKDVVFLINRSK